MKLETNRIFWQTDKQMEDDQDGGDKMSWARTATDGGELRLIC